MWYWVLVFAGGALGTGHCLGMCGGFIVLLSTHGDRRSFLGRQLIYHLGRITAYSLLGAMVGTIGQYVSKSFPGFATWWLVISGAGLVGAAIVSSGWFGTGRYQQVVTNCKAAQVFRQCLHGGQSSTIWLAGFVNGLIPCGLVYSYLAATSVTCHPLEGAATMALFGAGTLPTLVAAGYGLHHIPAAWRLAMQNVAVICVIVTGGLMLNRGWNLEKQASSACPFCSQNGTVSSPAVLHERLSK